MMRDKPWAWPILFLLTAIALLAGCASWVDVHRLCQSDAAKVLAASSNLPPETQQRNYQEAYRRCVTAYGFAYKLPPAP